MTSSDYQRALYDCVASPAFCLGVRRDPRTALAPYALSPKERRRIEAVVHQRGMSVSCSLYRMNRVTPVATLLPLTCRLLGQNFIALVERFWQECPTDLQFRTEILAFRDFLYREPEIDELGGPYLSEVLEFEIAANQLRFRARGDEQPRVRVVVFRHDPALLLTALAAERQPPTLQAGVFPVVLDSRTGYLQLSISAAETLADTSGEP